MSRSYKKYPVIVQEKDDMRQWNRSLRHNKLKEIPNGSAYKKDPRRSGIWKYRWNIIAVGIILKVLILQNLKLKMIM